MPNRPFQVFETPESACAEVAAEIAQLIRDRAVMGRRVVLGLATGASTIPLYEELRYLHREERLSFRNVVTFNMDEYENTSPAHPQSSRSFMDRHFFKHIDVQAENIHFPAAAPGEDVEARCARYEKQIAQAGGIDYQIAKVSRNGHIGFNSSFTPIDSRTRSVHLSEVAREGVSEAFGGLEKVPMKAITMGCATLLSSRRITLLAWGVKKSRIVRKAIRESVTPAMCASYFQTHPKASFVLDEQAASLL